MANTYIELGGFNPASYNLPVDARLTLKKSEMASVGTIGLAQYNTGKLEDGTIISLPNVYFCICLEDGKLYVFNTENTWESTFGKFRLAEGKPGTEVIPNPEDIPTETLRSIKIDETTYKVEDEFLTHGAGKPQPTETGLRGQLYIDTENSELYQFIHESNDVLLADPGTALPLYLQNCWQNIKTTGVEKILSSEYAPNNRTTGVRGQLFIDITTCEIYQCTGLIGDGKFGWIKISNNRGFKLSLTDNSYIPYKILMADGSWKVPQDAEQKIFMGVVAVVPKDDQQIVQISGLLSKPYEDMVDNKLGYTLISDALVSILPRE